MKLGAALDTVARVSQVAQSRIGGYRIVRKLAVGGMAEIFLAQLEASHGFTKQVVLKRLLPQLCEDPSFVKMFLHEARLTARLDHPNIAQVFDIGESEGRVYYAMEYVHGHDLRAVAKRMKARSGEPPLELVVGVGIGVAAGLHHAHTARDEHGRPLSIVHRDVTPSNVVVSYTGVPKLLDFGVAKAQVADRDRTTVGVLKGKLPYMSPEQIYGSTLDGRSDVFSLGIILWELSTLQRLYRFDSNLETVKRITTIDAPRPSSVRPMYPPKLEAIIMKALARDPSQRYANAFELQRVLENYALEHRMAITPSRMTELMAGLFAAELESERTLLESEPRESTDSEVLPARSLDQDTLNRVMELEPAEVVAMGLATEAVTAPVRVESKRSSKRAWPWIAAGAGSLALIVALTLIETDKPTAPREPSEDAAEPALEPAPALVPAPAPAAVVEPAAAPVELEAEPSDVAPEPEPEPDPEPESQPEGKSSKPKSTAKKSSKTSDWNKNSLALPE